MLGRTEPALELVGLFLPNLVMYFGYLRYGCAYAYCLRYRLTALLAA